jgi:hypothetical protein
LYTDVKDSLNLTSNRAKATYSENYGDQDDFNQNLKDFILQNDMGAVIGQLHIQSPQFNPVLFLDTFHTGDPRDLRDRGLCDIVELREQKLYDLDQQLKYQNIGRDQLLLAFLTEIVDNEKELRTVHSSGADLVSTDEQSGLLEKGKNLFTKSHGDYEALMRPILTKKTKIEELIVIKNGLNKINGLRHKFKMLDKAILNEKIEKFI